MTKIVYALLSLSITCVPAAVAESFELNVGSALNISAVLEKVENKLPDVDAIVQESDHADDVACDGFSAVLGKSEGEVADLPTTVRSKKDWETLVNDGRFGVFILDRILFCGKPAGGVIAGCAQKGGPIAFTRSSILRKDIGSVVIAHEIGHAQGRKSHHTTVGFLMYRQAMPESRGLSQGECGLFQQAQLFAAELDDGGDIASFPHLEKEVAEVNSVDIAELLSGVWFEGPPIDHILALNEDQIEEARRAIENPERLFQWANAATVLGLRGEEFDYDLLKEVVVLPVPSGMADDEVFQFDAAQQSAILAIGFLFNRTELLEAAQFLQLLMVAPSQAISVQENEERADALSDFATLAFAYAGPKARTAFPTAVAYAQLRRYSNPSLIGTGATIVASGGDGLDDTGRVVAYSNPSLAFDESKALEVRNRARAEIQSLEGFFSMSSDLATQVAELGLIEALR